MMASYDTIPTTVPEDGPKPKTWLKRVLAAVALTSFALGALAATAVTMPAGVTQTAFTTRSTLSNPHPSSSAGDSYIIDDCYGTQSCGTGKWAERCWYDLHVEYLNIKVYGIEGGWYCVGRPSDGDQRDENRRVGFFENGCLKGVDHVCRFGHDADDFSSTDCPAAYDQNYGQWRCFSEDDFGASSLSAWDLAYQTKRAARAYYPDDYSMDLYGSKGYFNIDEEYANKHPDKKHQYFYWSYATDKKEDPVYYEGVPEGDHWKLWRANEDTGGYYNVYKECDDVSTCWLKYICIQDGTDDTAWGDC